MDQKPYESFGDGIMLNSVSGEEERLDSSSIDGNHMT
jgi:hypothetical protein